MNRQTLIKLHMMTAAFMFPVVIMFLVTGALYTWGITGSYENSEHVIALDAPLNGDVEQMAAVITSELQKQNLAAPTGTPKVRPVAASFAMDWSGSKRDVTLEPTANPLEAKLIVKETTLLRNFVQLHKAKGGTLFKVYATWLAISLALLVCSGFFMAWQLPNYRKLANFTALVGAIVFVAMVSLS